jgi:hypothetical protein
MYEYSGLPGNGKCWYGRQRKSCRNDQVYIAKCSNSERQKFRFVKLSNNEVQIKLGDNSNRCFERDGRKIFVRRCNSSKSLQRWYAPNGSFDGRRFEVSQRGYSSQCMTQDHRKYLQLYLFNCVRPSTSSFCSYKLRSLFPDPKAGEVVELHSCRAARSRSHETSYWNKY